MARFLFGLGTFVVHRKWVVVGVWVLVAVAVFGAVATFGAQTNNDLRLPGTGSQSAKDLLAGEVPAPAERRQPDRLRRLAGQAHRPANKQAINDSVKAIKKQPHVYSVTNPLSSSGRRRACCRKDKQTAFAPVLMDVSLRRPHHRARAERHGRGRARRTRPGITIAAAGSIGTTLSDERPRPARSSASSPR